MTKVEGSNARVEAEKIVREKGGVCLVPLPGMGSNLSSHERTFCDCHVETILEKAIEKAERRGVVRGLRMAAEYLHEHGKNSGCAIAHEHWLKVEADKLEKEITK